MNKSGKQQNKVEDNTQPFEKAPIYRCAEMVLLNSQEIQANMSKKYKYSVGQELTLRCCELADAVSWAYVQEDDRKKAALLRNATRKAMRALIYHRICARLNLFHSHAKYIEQVDYIVSIIKQAKGWLNSTQNKLDGKARQPNGGNG